MFGRLQPGLHAAAAENELRSLAAVLRQQHPQDIWEDENLSSSPGGYAKNLGEAVAEQGRRAPTKRILLWHWRAR